MKKMILYMALGSMVTVASLVALEGKIDVDRYLKKMNRKSMRTYKYIKGKIGE